MHGQGVRQMPASAVADERHAAIVAVHDTLQDAFQATDLALATADVAPAVRLGAVAGDPQPIAHHVHAERRPEESW